MNKYDELLNKLYTLFNKKEKELAKHENLLKLNQEGIIEDENTIRENNIKYEKLTRINKILTKYTFDIDNFKNKKFWFIILESIFKILGLSLLVFIIGSFFNLNIVYAILIAIFLKIGYESLQLVLNKDIIYIMANYNLDDVKNEMNDILAQNMELQRYLRTRYMLVDKLKNKDLNSEKKDLKTIWENIKLVEESKNNILDKVLNEETNEKINAEFAKDDIIKKIRVIKEG